MIGRSVFLATVAVTGGFLSAPLAAQETLPPPPAANAESSIQDSQAEAALPADPSVEDDADDWSLDVFGRLMLDAGTIDAPIGAGIDDGFGNEVRRARLGAEGTVPGEVGYKVELDVATGEVVIFDALIHREFGGVEVTLGQHNTFQGLEELTSSLHVSFIERAAFTDAFNFERRVGASATAEEGIWLVQAGVFGDNLLDRRSDNRSFDTRLVAMPKFGEAQAHFGVSFHYNHIGSPDESVRYRQRPLVHFTSDRFVDTRPLRARDELGLGLESAIVSGPFHAMGEAFWQRVDRIDAPDDPTFFGGSIEMGYFLTPGDTRSYRSGKFERVRPKRKVGQGGFGSVQVNVRYDWLDLNDAGVIGGQQSGYFASLIWKPTDHLLFMLNYGHLEYDDAALAAADGDRSYNDDVFGVRAQFDF
ncbi:MAG: hypothetical protein K5799_00310 [Erythrobacter sp.]|nr:hypothetical protein [Erythrobacter sp.]